MMYTEKELEQKKQELSRKVKSIYDEAHINIENASDGYHTFKELYEFRRMYNAALFNNDKTLNNVHKSLRHSDGELCFGGGWFIVVAYTSNGEQISNHYENEFMSLFDCELRDVADEWDGHTSQDVLERLKRHIKK